MEATVEKTQRVLVQDIEKLTEQSYVVERMTTHINDFRCIYVALEIPEDFILLISPNRSNGFAAHIFNRNNEQKSTSQLLHISQYGDSYKRLKKVELLVKDAPVEEVKNTNDRYYYNSGVVNVIVDSKLRICFPQNYYNGQHDYPAKLVKNEKGYFINTLGTLFKITTIVDQHQRYSSDDDKMPVVERKIYNMLNAWNVLKTFKFETDRATMNEILFIFSGLKELPITNTEGITKTLAGVKAFYENSVQKDFVSALAFKAVADSCKSTVGGIKYSTVFNKLFATIDTQEKFDERVTELSKIYIDKMSSLYYSKNDYLIAVLDTLSDAREMKKAVLKRKSTGAFNKIMDDIEFIQIDKDKYPLSYAAIMSGEIPTSTFFRKSGESYFIYNDNWDIWEEILVDHKEVAIAIATEASKRTTYEKDIMSYFYFVLHGLPEYLERNTGKKWRGVPKLVSSSNELDPPAEGSNGVAKSRSALTPIVDNENSEVIIPYVSMQVSGYQTTYCYGLNYSVLQRGFSFLGNTVSQDVEKNLNGRDNYGLMFYTLTGTAQGRGYPTFLIIFENMDKEKYGQNYRVHFHRTHPMRSKGGDYNPIHNWTKGCYKWMIGNVNYERIVAQQGDLAFVQIDEMPEGEITEVNAYDNHCFSKPVKFAHYLKKEKQNILGYVMLDEAVVLNHNEHLNREIPKGIYEIRQCRSWEANPKGIWSLRID